MQMPESSETIKQETFDLVKRVKDWILGAGGHALDFLLRAAFAILIYFLIARAARTLTGWLDKHFKKLGMEDSARRFLLSLIRYGILIFSIVTIIVQLHIVEASAIAALIASAGVGISLAMQGTLSNFAGGVLLLLLRPFRAEDYIEVPAISVEGTVKAIDMYYTKICTVDNREISIPNSNLTNNAVINFTAQKKRRIDITTGISYDSDLKKAKGILAQLIAADGRIEKEERQIFVSKLDASAVQLTLRAWVKTEDFWPVTWAMNEKIKESFDREKIEIPYDQLDVHIRPKTGG